MTFVMITVGLIILMNLAGLQTTTGWILGGMGINAGNIQNFNLTAFYIAIAAGIAALIGVGGIRIGTFGIDVSSISVSAAVSLPFALLIGDLISIMISASSAGQTWASYIIFLIITPLLFGYAISLFDWARGAET